MADEDVSPDNAVADEAALVAMAEQNRILLEQKEAQRLAELNAAIDRAVKEIEEKKKDK